MSFYQIKEATMYTISGRIPVCLLTLFLFQMSMHAPAGAASSSAQNPAPLSSPPDPPVASGSDQTPPQLVLSRSSAVAMAVYRNIDLRIEALNFKMAETETAKSWGIYNPVLNASVSSGVSAIPGDAFFLSRNSNASIGLIQNLPTGGNLTATTQTGYFSFGSTGPATKDWQSTAGLNVTLPLLKNAGKETVEMNIIVAATTQQDSLERFRASTMETVSNVITTYNHLYVLRQAQETRVAALNSAQKLLDEIKKKAKPGAVQGMELANAEFAIAQRRKDLVEAYRSVRDQEVSLRYLIGLDLPTKIIPSDPPFRDEPQETDEQAVKSALEYRSDLKQLHLGLKTAQLQERVARRQSWPELSVTGGGGVTGSGFTFGESYQQIGNHPGTFWNVGMLLSVPLGNTTAENEYRKSKIKTEQVQHQIRALTWKIRNDIEADMRALISARLQMQLSEKSSQLAEQRLEEYRKNNLLGSATIQDVLNAENDRNIAHNTQLEAVETFSTAVIKLWKDAGLLLDRHGIHIDTSHPDKLTESKDQNPSLLVDAPALATPPTSPAVLQEQTLKQTSVTTPSAARTSSDVAPKPSTGALIHEPVPAALPGYTLTIGEYADKTTMDAAIKKLHRAGLIPTVMTMSRKPNTMIRLHIADYSDQKSARREIEKLRKFKVDGFVIAGKDGTFSVYAGSYRNQKQAVIEQERLAALGIKTVPKDSAIPSTMFKLTAGSFATQKAAAETAAKLKKQGLKAVVTKNGE